MKSQAKNTAAPTTLTPRHRLGMGLVVLLVIAGGVAQRSFSGWVQAALDAPVQLDPPLRSLAHEIGDWRGEDIEMREAVLKIAGNDDYVNRAYTHAATRRQVSLYVGYTARPRTMLRHRPGVCYPSAGWTPADPSEQTLTLPDGRSLPVRVQTFFKPGLREARVVVLNYYVLAGVPTIDEHSFWSLGWRTPNLARDASRYVAQVQVTAVVGVGGDEAAERLCEEFAVAAGPEILALLPAINGQ